MAKKNNPPKVSRTKKQTDKSVKKKTSEAATQTVNEPTIGELLEKANFSDCTPFSSDNCPEDRFDNSEENAGSIYGDYESMMNGLIEIHPENMPYQMDPYQTSECITALLDRLHQEKKLSERLIKENMEEYSRLIALQSQTEAELVMNHQAAIEEKEIALQLLEQESAQKLEAQRKEAAEFIEQQKAALRKRETALNRREKKLFEQETDLEGRAANASMGFIEEQRAAIAQYLEQFSEAQIQLALVKGQHVEEIARHKRELGSLESDYLAGLQSQLEEKQADLEKWQSRLSASESNLETQKATLDHSKAMLRASQSSQKEWEADINRKVRDEFAYEVSELKKALQREKDHLHNEQSKNDTLQNALREFADLQSTFDNADAEEIHSRFRQLQKENRELKAKQYLNDEDLGEKCDILEEQLGDRTDELKELRVELEEAKGELHKRNISVMEKQNLVQEKRILEMHKRTLEASIEQLRTQIDDLIERQQGSETFPALSLMDKEHRIAASNLQPVPNKLKDFADQLRFGMASIYENSPLYYREEDVRLFLGGLAMSNLHILQGMSGTGKTSLAKAFAKVVGGYCTDIAVQAGWRDKDDLLGHYNAFEKRFYERETLQAIYRSQLPEYQDRINIILLDEMNLSRPEQYFAEFLSAIEMRPEDRKIVLVESEQKNAPTLLEKGRKLRVPENVWFIGTANHDETTNEFADKTYDRAHVMELIRNEGTFNADAYEPGITYSFKSLQNAFNMVCQNGKAPVEKILNDLAESDLARVLESDFGVSWGNRFGRHALRFLPVVKNAGGTYEEALDHLLATKVFRHGKATGRYDLTSADLDNVSTALVETWQLLGMNNEPEACLKAISKDRKRMERGA